jgi:hypothetical protein
MPVTRLTFIVALSYQPLGIRTKPLLSSHDTIGFDLLCGVGRDITMCL